MKSMWNSTDAREILERVARLRPDAPARWGRFTAPQMLCHLTDGARMAMGELAVAPRHLPIRYFPLKQLVLYVLPFPKGAPTAPELIARTATNWAGEVDELTRAYERFIGQQDRHDWPDHPAFGTMSGKAWATLMYRHTNHHLTQFGV